MGIIHPAEPVPPVSSRQPATPEAYYAQPNGGNEPPRKKGSSGVLVFIIIMLLLAGGGYGAYWYLNQTTDTENLEMLAYENLEGNETLADYEDFIERYPESPRIREVKERYEVLKKMYAEWRDIVITGNRRDYEVFMQNYSGFGLSKMCEVKLDSLDWLDAQADGSPEAIALYLSKHPNGHYLAEANSAQNKILAATPTTEEKLLVEETLRGFFRAFGDNDTEAVFTFITPTMTRFLSRENATKADVADIIESTYNIHILACKFVLNGDSKVTKLHADTDDPAYKVTFTVDQHIERDNEGKTFGSYTAEAVITAQFKLSSLTMNEVSRKTGAASTLERITE